MLHPEEDTSLRDARRAAGLSLRQLEEQTGINRGLLSTYERGIPDEHQKLIDRAIRLAHIEQKKYSHR